MPHGLRISPDLLLPFDAITATQVVYGGKGMGKTNYGIVLVEELTKAHLRWSVLDPLGVWYGLRHSIDGKGPGIDCLILGGMRGDIPIEPTGGAVVADLVVDEPVNVIIDFSRRPNGKVWSMGEKVRFVTDYTVRVFERQGEIIGGRRHEPFMQILDEAARYIPQVIPSGAIDLARCVGAWEQLVEEGRNFGIGVGLLTQRSARMNKSVSELADAIIAFRIVGPRSIEAVTDWLGEHLERDQVKENVRIIRGLPRGDALIVSPGWLKFEKVAHIRIRETFDSSATPKPGEHRHEPKRAQKPDLEKYQARMAETIERAKANDPKELRARIAALEKDLAKKGAVSPPSNEAAKHAPAIDPAAIARAVEKAVQKREREFERSTKAVRNAIEIFLSEADKRAAMVQTFVEHGRDRLKVAIELLNDVKVYRPAEEYATVTVHPNRQPLKPETAKALNHLAHAATVTLERSGRVPDPSNAGTPIPKGEKAVLAAIAQYPNGVTRQQLTVLTGYKKTSRDAYIARLRDRGYIDVVADGRIVATEAGIAALGNDYEPPLTGEARREKYLRELPAGESKVFKIAIDHFPEPVSRDVVGSLTGYKKTSRDAYIARLRARELIEVSREGIRASEDLF